MVTKYNLIGQDWFGLNCTESCYKCSGGKSLFVTVCDLIGRSYLHVELHRLRYVELHRHLHLHLVI